MPNDDFHRLLENNRRWAAEKTAGDPDYFRRRADGQSPDFLFIGCSDSRVPAEELLGTRPGEMFVHRNIANQVRSADLNVLSVIQFAVDVLEVEHILVVGHLGCGGVRASTQDASLGIVDHWVNEIRTLQRLYAEELAALPDDRTRGDRLVELNVMEQIYNLSQIPTIRAAWKRRKAPMLHGLVYGLEDGLLREVATAIDTPAEIEEMMTKGR